MHSLNTVKILLLRVILSFNLSINPSSQAPLCLTFLPLLLVFIDMQPWRTDILTMTPMRFDIILSQIKSYFIRHDKSSGSFLLISDIWHTFSDGLNTLKSILYLEYCAYAWRVAEVLILLLQPIRFQKSSSSIGMNRTIIEKSLLSIERSQTIKFIMIILSIFTLEC